METLNSRLLNRLSSIEAAVVKIQSRIESLKNELNGALTEEALKTELTTQVPSPTPEPVPEPKPPSPELYRGSEYSEIEGSCFKKKSYNTARAAGKAADRAHQNGSTDNLRVYDCLYCGGFHLTKVPLEAVINRNYRTG